MRLKILFETKKDTLIPWSYHSELTKLVYNLVGLSDKNYSTWLHDEGYRKNKKIYRLFVFSDLQFAELAVLPEGLRTRGSVVWQLASPDERFIEKLKGGIKILNNKITLFESEFNVLDTLETQLPINEKSVFHTISPIVASIQEKGKGSPPSYLAPQDQRFTEALERNLLSKWEAFCNKPVDKGGFGIRVWEPRSKLVSTFNIQVRAWHLKLQMWGLDELMKFAYDVGLGERNSQGFGMIEVS